MKKVASVLFIIIIGAVLYSFGISTFENAKVNSLIADFKSRGVLLTDEPTAVNNTLRYYYEVESDSYLDQETFLINENTNEFYLGNVGDIVVTRESPFPNIPIIHQFISYYFGGHAAMVTDVNKIVEIAGFPSGDEKISDYIFHKVQYDDDGNPNHDFKGATIFKTSNYFLKNTRKENDPAYKRYGEYYRKNLITLRVNKSSEIERKEAVLNLEELIDKNVIYNFMFFLDTKEKYYCTDIMPRIYDTIKDDNNNSKYNLNDDGFITSVNDLILSKDTIITNYFEVDKNGIEHIYYLVNSKNQGN